MAKISKNRKAALAKFDSEKELSLEDAAKLVKEITFTKFDSSSARKQTGRQWGIAFAGVVPFACPYSTHKTGGALFVGRAFRGVGRAGRVGVDPRGALLHAPSGFWGTIAVIVTGWVACGRSDARA
jgi:hypothetical protein